jgi:polyisoprenoid-binding protein YceI
MEAMTNWVIDHKHSGIVFKVRHLMIAHVKGSFKIFDASITMQGNDFTSAIVHVWIDAVSIDTGNAERDVHLRGTDFFDVEKFPRIHFNSTSVVKLKEEDKYELSGELSIKGISKPVSLIVEYGGTVKDPWGKEMSGFKVDGKVNRSDWGIIFNMPLELGGVLVGEEVTITAEIELIKGVAHEPAIETPNIDNAEHIM